MYEVNLGYATKVAKSKSAAKKIVQKAFAGRVTCFFPYKWTDDWTVIDVYDSFSSDRSAKITKI